MTPYDRLAVGITLIVIGVLMLALHIPYAGAAIGLGLGFVIAAIRRLAARRS